MKFEKYGRLVNHYQEKFINNVAVQLPLNEAWVATEKIHGANISFWCDGTTVKVARRTAFLEDDEKFYAVSILIREVMPKLISLYEQMVKDKIVISGRTVVFTGEYAGGFWFGEKATAHTARVGKGGIWYSPKGEFFGFDILLPNNRYLSWQRMTDYYKSAFIFTAPIVYVETYSQLLKKSNLFLSKVGDMLGLKTPDHAYNQAEGFVMRPRNKEFVLRNGNRVLIKSVYRNHDDDIPRRDEPVDTLPDEIEKNLQLMFNKVDQARVISLCSKEGEPEPKDIPRFTGLISQDIQEEFEEDTGLVVKKFFTPHSPLSSC